MQEFYMKYYSSKETADKWNLSERGVRNLCSKGKIAGAVLIGKCWKIPEDAVKPEAPAKKTNILLQRLREEKKSGLKGGIYHRIQIDLTYNSNHIEGSRLSHDQTRYIFETHTIDGTAEDTDDIIETMNHFRCIDMVISNANRKLSEHFIFELHKTLKSGTSDSRRSWFAVGRYKKLPNEVGGIETVSPSETPAAVKELLDDWNAKTAISFDDLLEFHYRFERIHPFQDGNGRIGRLIMFKECLRFGIVPFIIDDREKMFYYRGLAEWKHTPGYLRDTCLHMQDGFKKVLDYFDIPY
ncbi:MAG TPA: Fic family protein [Methanocorpusculum sp.]|nr:Fic family protein [Methanocorpusculum sp.]